MTVDRLVHILAGTFVLGALALGAPASPLFVSANFLWLAVFVGANLFQHGFTGICPLASVLRWLGVPTMARA